MLILNPDIVVPEGSFGTDYIYVSRNNNNREYNRWYNLSDVIKNNLQFSIGNYYRYNYKNPMFLFFYTYASWEEAGGCGVIIDGHEYRYSGAGYGDCVYAIVKAGSWFSLRMYNYYLGSVTTLFLPKSNNI